MDSISNQHNLSKLLLIHHKRTYFAKQANNNNIKHFLYTIAHLKPMDDLSLSDNLADFLKKWRAHQKPSQPARREKPNNSQGRKSLPSKKPPFVFACFS